jgi:hypothetical protein
MTPADGTTAGSRQRPGLFWRFPDERKIFAGNQRNFRTSMKRDTKKKSSAPADKADQPGQVF